MPLEKELRDQVLDYCDKHLPRDEDVALMFDFIADPRLKERIEMEFYAAR